MKTVNIVNRPLYIIDDTISEDIEDKWSKFILSDCHDPSHIYQDIGHDYMSEQQVVENRIIVHQPELISNLEVISNTFKCLHRTMINTVKPGEYYVKTWYTNIMTPESQPWLHRDSRLGPEESFTALWYPNLDWHPNWGGETLFYHLDTTDTEFFNESLNYNKDKTELHTQLNDMLYECEITAVIPKPGRVVIFDSGILHSGRCPQHKTTRISTALKIAATSTLSSC